MRRFIVSIAAAVLASCGAPLVPSECYPTVVQPTRHAQLQLLGRVAGCPGLVAVSGEAPGVVLYVLRANLDLSDEQLQVLPEVQRGR